ncbi:hypothetical protein GCM10011379_29940 [Filimonas zeae]|uniref:Uncharacterized protein n=2 Tax=Filimonas zeae TaxID=1737353 RepID=A0A917IYF1_9BACT|nr:hypothetical protein [Filimonas zeae]GGH71029.1 hypothetical protein GCM10011379_29940 [Filimonas zeae]
MEQFETRQSYIDTFSENAHRFRLTFDTATFSATVEKRSANGTWQLQFLVEQVGNSYTYDHNTDVNGDGFTDFRLHYRSWTDYVYLFHPEKERYSDSVIAPFFQNQQLLDSSKKLYRGHLYARHNDGYSAIYTYHGYQPWYYYILRFSPVPGDLTTLGKVELYKCVRGNLDTVVKIRNIPFNHRQANEFYFNDSAFWARNYRSLLKTQRIPLPDL